MNITPPTVLLSVPQDGSGVILTFNGIVSGVRAGEYKVYSDGVLVPSSKVRGSLKTWLVLTTERLCVGATITLTYDGFKTVDYDGNGLIPFVGSTVTNNSAVTPSAGTKCGFGTGMFIHFSLATYNNVEVETGAENRNGFNPTAIDIDQWLDAASLIGARYVVLVCKHAGGFCLWPSATTPHTVANTTWYSGGFDIVSRFVTRARARGFLVGLYCSFWDLYWEKAHPGFTAAQRVTHIEAQFTELLSNYGSVDFFWTDCWGWAIGYAAAPYAPTHALIKTLQPGVVHIENNHEHSLDHSDLVEYEVASTSDGFPTSRNPFPKEACQTIRASGNWFSHSGDTTNLPPQQIASNDRRVNAIGGSYLLNVPPGIDGKISTADIATLTSVGPLPS